MDEQVVDLTTDELDEVGIACGHLHDLFDRFIAKPHRAFDVFERLADGVFAVAGVQPIEKHHPEHPLGEGSGIHQFGKQHREAGEHQHQWHVLALQGLEGVQHERERVFLFRGLIGEILRLVVGEDDAAYRARTRQRLPSRLEDALDLVERQPRRVVVDVAQGLVIERVLDGSSAGGEPGHADLPRVDDDA